MIQIGADMLNLATDALTPRQLEEQTGFTTATLATWRSRGTGPKYVKIMNRVYYLKSDVQAWLEEEMAA